MTKSIILAFQFIGILALALTQKHDIKIAHDAPASMQPGEEKVVSITLDKSDVVGFAKFQITLSDGLSAEVIDAAGASFTFNNQAAKFIWMALPNQRKVTMRVRIKADANAVGMLEMQQRFSYIYNNERKNYDAPSHLIAVGDGQAITALEVKKSMAEKAKNLNATVSSKRSINNAGINQWRVDVDIEKENIGGFAKIEERIPHGYTAIDLKSSGAIFSIDDRELKYIWYDFPDAERITVSYKLLPVIAMEAREPEISGIIAFIVDDEGKEVPIGESFIGKEATEYVEVQPSSDSAEPMQPQTTQTIEPMEVVEEEIAEAPNEPEPIPAPVKAPQEQVEPKPEVTAPKPQPSPEPVSAKPKPTPTKPATQRAYTDANIVDVPKPQEGIHFRVQLAAGHKILQKDMFSHLYNFREGFILENHEGWVKYTTGQHSTYADARNDRERIKNDYSKFKGPFVTAYNTGERITVQEALMVTKQRWIP